VFGISDPGGVDLTVPTDLTDSFLSSCIDDARNNKEYRLFENTQNPSDMTSRIVATSRQTRFNPLIQGDASEVDLHDVNISVGEREILVDGRIRLKGGVKYGMIGR
jgi:hypothetical protein